MATQGLVSVTQNGKVILKVVAGCSGDRANRLANAIWRDRLADLAAVRVAAVYAGFGCHDCLVVMNETDVLYDDGEVTPLYRKTFNDPRFNPRWECGLVEDDCCAVIVMPLGRAPLPSHAPDA